MLNKVKFKKGMALLMTLSIMSMIMLVVNNSFERTSTELQLELQEKRLFDLRRASVSVIRAVNSQLLILGAGQFYHFFSNFGNFEVPIPLFQQESDVSISNFSIKSIDHHFYINREGFSATNDDVLGQLTIFRNILNNFANEDNTDFKPSLINNFIGELVDWIDTDSQPVNNNFLLGREFYPEFNPAFTVKNARLDSLTELMLMPSFRGMNILSPGQSVFDLPLKIVRPTAPNCYLGPLDLNMLPPDKDLATETVLTYISWVKNITIQDCKYQLMYDNRAKLADLIGSFLDKKESPPYKVPLRDDPQWDQQTLLLGVQNAKSALSSLFSARSELIEIEFTLINGLITQNYIVHMLLEYSNSQSPNPNNVKVVYFFRS